VADAEAGHKVEGIAGQEQAGAEEDQDEERVGGLRLSLAADEGGHEDAGGGHEESESGGEHEQEAEVGHAEPVEAEQEAPEEDLGGHEEDGGGELAQHDLRGAQRAGAQQVDGVGVELVREAVAGGGSGEEHGGEDEEGQEDGEGEPVVRVGFGLRGDVDKGFLDSVLAFDAEVLLVRAQEVLELGHEEGGLDLAFGKQEGDGAGPLRVGVRLFDDRCEVARLEPLEGF
jgi:hypothetical protein